MAYASGEFDPKIGSRLFSVSAAIFGGELWVVGGNFESQGTPMYQTCVPIAKLNIEKGDLTNPSNWSSSQLQIQGISASTHSRCGLAPTSAGLLLVWEQQSGILSNTGSLLASLYSAASGQPAWAQAMTLLDMNGTALQGSASGPGSGSDVSVTACGNDSVLISCAGATSGGQACVYLASYRVADMGQKWQAAWSCYITPAEPGLPGVGLNISMDWFPTAPTSDQTESQPAFYLQIFLNPAQQGGSALPPQYLLLPMDLSSDGTYMVPQVNASFLELTVFGSGQYSVFRDPANRLQAYETSANTIYRVPFNTYSTPPTLGSDGVFTSSVHAGPVTAVYYMTPALGTVPTSSVYEIFLYGPAEVLCQVNFFGSAQVVTSTTLQPVDVNQHVRNVILGIVDGPVPFPNVNCASINFQDTEFQCGDLTISSSSSVEQAVQSTSSVSFGLRTEGGCTEGVGAAWDVAVSSGWTNVTGSSTTSLLTKYETVHSPLDMQSKTVKPLGTLYCAPALIEVTTYVFKDANGNVVCDSSQPGSYQAPQFFSAKCGFGDAQLWGYVPFSTTAGDVRNYTPENLNARMKELGYTGENYFGEIIVPNACSFAGGNPYLEAAWDPEASTSEGFTQTQSSFTSQSWQFDNSVYAGISGGGGIDVFGLGEEADFSILAGFSATYVHDSSQTQQSEWGISLSDTWGPPGELEVGQGDLIGGYSIRIYFLPVPSGNTTLPDGTTMPANYWTQELLKYQQPPQPNTIDWTTIDPNSGAWRIVYVVTSYHTVDGTESYAYDGSLGGEPQAAASLAADSSS